MNIVVNVHNANNNLAASAKQGCPSPANLQARRSTPRGSDAGKRRRRRQGLSRAQASRLLSAFQRCDEDLKGGLNQSELSVLVAELNPGMLPHDADHGAELIWHDVEIEMENDEYATYEELMAFLNPDPDDDDGPRFASPETPSQWVWALVEQSAAMDYENEQLVRVSIGFSLFMQFVILVSVILIVVESLPELQPSHCDPPGPCTPAKNAWDRNMGLFLTEAACVGLFTIELMLRIGSTPELRKLLTSGWNAIDVLAILPFYLDLTGVLEAGGSNGGDMVEVLRILRLARLVRVLRVLRLGRNSEGIQIMVVSLGRSRMALTWLSLLLVMASLLFASLIFAMEKDFEADFIEAKWSVDSDKIQEMWVRKSTSSAPDAGQPILFQSIPTSMWWALVTLTTVGYGDMTPVTIGGRIIGGITMFSGLLVMAFPTTMLCNNFTDVCAEFLQRKQRKQRRDQAEQARALLFVPGGAAEGAAAVVRHRCRASIQGGTERPPGSPRGSAASLMLEHARRRRSGRWNRGSAPWNRASGSAYAVGRSSRAALSDADGRRRLTGHSNGGMPGRTVSALGSRSVSQLQAGAIAARGRSSAAWTPQEQRPHPFQLSVSAEVPTVEEHGAELEPAGEGRRSSAPVLPPAAAPSPRYSPRRAEPRAAWGVSGGASPDAAAPAPPLGASPAPAPPQQLLPPSLADGAYRGSTDELDVSRSLAACSMSAASFRPPVISARLRSACPQLQGMVSAAASRIVDEHCAAADRLSRRVDRVREMATVELPQLHREVQELQHLIKAHLPHR